MIAVTGGGGALGRAVVARLEHDGYAVSAPGHDEVDLLDADATARWAASLDDVRGLVHLVGGWKGGAEPEDTAWLHAQLVTTLQNATRAFLEPLKRTQGQLVIVSSKQVERPSWSNAAYAAAKAAAEAWTLALADEIHANVVAINAIVTPEMRAEKPEAKFSTFQDVDVIADTIALLVGSQLNRQRIKLY